MDDINQHTHLRVEDYRPADDQDADAGYENRREPLALASDAVPAL